MGGQLLDLVTHDDAQPALPAVHLEGRTALTYGELAELVGEFERALRCGGKALVLCAGDRDLPTLLAYRPAAEMAVGTSIFQRKDSQLAGEIYTGTPLLASSGSTGSPKTGEESACVRHPGG